MGVWKEKKFETIPFDKQAEIHVIQSDGLVEKNGKLRDTDRITGTFSITRGRTGQVVFVRNHSLIDEPVILSGNTLFTGNIAVADNGSINFEDLNGVPISSSEIKIQGYFLQNGSLLTAWAFGAGLAPIGSWGNYIVTIAVFLFALSTAISWSYYGDRSIEYLLGTSAIIPYRVIFCIMQFVGAVFSLEIVWGFGDAALGLMAIPNLIALIALSGVVKHLTDDYFSRPHKRYRKSLFDRK